MRWDWRTPEFPTPTEAFRADIASRRKAFAQKNDAAPECIHGVRKAIFLLLRTTELSTGSLLNPRDPLLQLRFSQVGSIFLLPHAPRDPVRVHSVAWSGHKELGLVGKPGFLIYACGRQSLSPFRFAPRIAVYPLVWISC